MCFQRRMFLLDIAECLGLLFDCLGFYGIFKRSTCFVVYIENENYLQHFVPGEFSGIPWYAQAFLKTRIGAVSIDLPM